IAIKLQLLQFPHTQKKTLPLSSVFLLSRIRRFSVISMASTLVIVVVFVLDLIAFSLAVAAEQRRNTADVNNEGFCMYDSDIATGLGIGSLVSLLVSQLVIMGVTRCLCCGRAMRPSGARSWAIVLFITTWVFFFIAEVCLLAGSIRNAKHTAYLPENSFSCKAMRKGVFAAGAAFVVFTGIASEFYYINHSRANDGQPSLVRDAGVTMGRL
ncbi:hypothetical protein LINPERPRIM_LOCUS18558, partial [Linum perenne]